MMPLNKELRCDAQEAVAYVKQAYTQNGWELLAERVLEDSEHDKVWKLAFRKDLAIDTTRIIYSEATMWWGHKGRYDRRHVTIETCRYDGAWFMEKTA